jgi:hypothetical protein
VPSDAYIVDYNDYMFNPWQSGTKISAIPHPVVTLLVTETSGGVGYSWHQPQSSYVLVNNPPSAPPDLHAAYNNALNEVSFMDGHISYIKIYNDEMTISDSYDPILGYDYQWSK